MAIKTSESVPHPTLLRRIGNASETALLLGAITFIWGTVIFALVSPWFLK